MESLLTEAIVSTMVALVGPKHEMRCVNFVGGKLNS